MKLIIAGSRSITSYDTVKRAIIESGLWAKHKKSIEVVSGKADGVDTLGEEFAKKNGLQIHSFPAKWDDIEAPGAVVRTRRDGKKFNLLAGIWRNHEMGDFADEALIVWSGITEGPNKSTGSLDMATYMAELGKPSYLHPIRSIPADLFDSLTAKGVEIITPKSLTGS